MTKNRCAIEPATASDIPHIWQVAKEHSFVDESSVLIRNIHFLKLTSIQPENVLQIRQEENDDGSY